MTLMKDTEGHAIPAQQHDGAGQLFDLSIFAWTEDPTPTFSLRGPTWFEIDGCEYDGPGVFQCSVTETLDDFLEDAICPSHSHNPQRLEEFAVWLEGYADRVRAAARELRMRGGNGE